MKNLKILTFILAFLLPFLSVSQGWERDYDGGGSEIVRASDRTLDGGIIMAGVQNEIPGSTSERPFLYKVDQDGNLVWEYYDLDHLGNDVRVYDVMATADGNYLIGLTFGPNSSSQIPVLQKISPDGTVLWEYILPTVNLNYVTDLVESSDGSYYAMGPNDDAAGATGVTKLDNAGNFIWEVQVFDPNDPIFPNDLLVMENGNILALTQFAEVVSTNLTITSFTENGDFNWLKVYDDLNPYTIATEAIETSNGDILITGVTAFDLDADKPFLMKIDDAGNVIWTKIYSVGDNHSVGGLVETDNGDIVVMGSEGSFMGTTPYDLFLLKVDSNGDEIWDKRYGRNKNEIPTNVFLASDSGFYLTSSTQAQDDSYNAFVIKTDSLGISLTNEFSGKLYFDENDDCSIGISEEGFDSWLVEAVKGDEQYLTTTGPTGDFDFTLDTGTYLITAYPPTPYWGVCNNNFEITFITDFENISEDIGAQADIECPLLDVSIGTPILRRCFENTYNVQYCNYGTITAVDPYIEIEFDSAMIILDASIDITSQDGNLLTFELDDIPIGECGSFTVDIALGDSTNCDSILLGATHCVEAHIYPDSICLPSNNWSGASVEVAAVCEEDSVSFFIQNVGTAPTALDLNYIVIEDDVVLLQGQFDLGIGGSLPISVATNGSMFRLEAEQEPNHPGMSMPSVNVEGCGVGNPDIQLGFINLFAQDDGDPFVDIDCMQNTGSYDPNDKNGFPLGRGSENYIDKGQDIEYMIRFQNTGTDTAFTVVVLDTLSDFLDITTVRPGASSHTYDFDIGGDGVLSFTFNNIMLPDSNVNFAASNGYVKFKVAQMPDLDLETQVYNSAAIYFDFNQPVITNETLHTVGEILLTSLRFIPSPTDLAKVKVYPNPFSDFTNIELEGVEINQGNFNLYDSTGRLLRRKAFNTTTFVFDKKEMLPGMYFFTIENEGQLIASGKLIAQ